MEKINEIIYSLVNQGIIKSEDTDFAKLKSGTTNGILYTLHNNEIPKYVIKIDQPKIIATTEDFLLTYKDVNLLPNVLYTDEKKEFIVYSYISGETHFNRGSKLEWMTILIKELLNKFICTWVLSVLVQKLQDNCNESLNLGHTDTITLKKCVIGMEKQNLFKWKHYQPDIILLTVRWYLRYTLVFVIWWK